MADAEEGGVEAVDVTMGESMTPMTMVRAQTSTSGIVTVVETGVEWKNRTGFAAPTVQSDLT